MTNQDNNFPAISEGQIGGTVVRTVNARDLHASLWVKSEFRNWIKNRISDCDFEQDIDFVAGKFLPGSEQIDYFLTIDAAKEISMLEKNERGKAVRKHFIECEKQLNGKPIPSIDVRDPGQLTKIALQLIEVNGELAKRAEVAEKAVEAAKPKTDFFDNFANADGIYCLRNAARVLNQPPNKFIQRLKQGYLFYEGGALVPKVQFRERGIFEVKCTMVDDKARYQTFVTPKGIQYFAKRLGAPQ
jgi:anti-repressor protein